MLYILLGIAFGVLICYGLVKDYLQMRSSTNRYLQNSKDYVRKDHSLITGLVDLIGIVAAIFTGLYGQGYFGGTKDNLTTALSIALVFMFIGQYMTMRYRASWYENETSIITCGKLIRFKSVKKIEISSGMQKLYSVTTFNGENVQITKKTAEFLMEKTGIKLTRKAR